MNFYRILSTTLIATIMFGSNIDAMHAVARKRFAVAKQRKLTSVQHKTYRNTRPYIPVFPKEDTDLVPTNENNLRKLASLKEYAQEKLAASSYRDPYYEKVIARIESLERKSNVRL